MADKAAPGSTEPAGSGRANVALGAVSLIGAGLSIYLLKVHVINHYTDGVAGGLCNVSAVVNCNTAADSAFAEVGGVPIAALGLGFYLAAVGASAVYAFRPERARLLPCFLVALYALACLYSLFLAAVSGLVLGSVCPACFGLYVVNILGLLLARGASGRTWRGAFADLYAELIPATFGLQGAVLGGTFAVSVFASVWIAHGVGRAMEAESGSKVKGFMEVEYPKAPRIDAALQAEMAQGPQLGPDDAPVTLVAFSDFQCPFCSRLGPDLERLVETRAGKVRVIFRHFPMDMSCNRMFKRDFHVNACNGARAAFCAHRQGKFWPMHDQLFSNQRALTPPDLPGHAAAVGLDVAAFEACLNEKETADAIAADIELGIRGGCRGTPSLFINGTFITGAKPLPLLEAFVDYELKRGAPAEQP